MLALALILLAFVCAAVTDWASCGWQEARVDARRGRRWAIVRGILLAMLLESVAWAPVWFALTLEDPRLAYAAVLGAGAGTAMGFHRGRRRAARAGAIGFRRPR